MDDILELVTVNELARQTRISHAAARRRLTKALVAPDALAVIGGSRGVQPLYLAARLGWLVETLTVRAEQATPDELVCRLAPRPDGTKVIRPLPLPTPWRVVLLGDRPGTLLESGTLYCLNDPPAVPDTSWIKPGKITFPWWNGDAYDGQPGAPILSFEMVRKYIDFCARHGLPTHSLASTELSVHLCRCWCPIDFEGVAFHDFMSSKNHRKAFPLVTAATPCSSPP
ncbi:MAG: glycoside hydrolase family 97 catalytic domain-containing protein [Verrucomicrobia bacterium]|nr:glycoside hydrolase family 97 catalytic domain-containing protein [Verrucomicrobiota bacterium]